MQRFQNQTGLVRVLNVSNRAEAVGAVNKMKLDLPPARPVKPTPRYCALAPPAVRFEDSYSINSLADDWIKGGTERPSAIAVLRFKTISNWVGS